MTWHSMKLWITGLALACGAAIALVWALRSDDHVAANTLPPAVEGPVDERVESQKPTDHRIGKQIADFTLRDVYGQPRTLEEFAESELVVVAFMGTECPLAVLYTPRLMELAERFQPRGAAFLAINSNQQDTLLECRQYIELNNLNFPLLKDPDNRVADQFEAVRTPEVFVLDADRRVRYWGQIDGKFGFQNGMAFDRLHGVRNHLELALEELLAGKPVSVPSTESMGCHIGRLQKSDSDTSVTWSGQIAGIFQRRCQICHRPDEIAPFPLLTYEEVQGWEAMILEVVEEGRMPPWHADPKYGKFINDARLTAEEKGLIGEWVRHGAPLGDPALAPPPRDFGSRWGISDPDMVIFISEEPVEIPATGVLENKYFVVDPGFTEGMWVVDAEARVDCKPVVHHMNVLVTPPAASNDLDPIGLSNKLTGYLPGLHRYDRNKSVSTEKEEADQTIAARYIPAGSVITFEMHYQTNGRPQRDRSSLALKFAKSPPAVAKNDDATSAKNDDASAALNNRPPVKNELVALLTYDVDFNIPPHAANHRVECWHMFADDATLTLLQAHMHTRGKSMRFTAHYPDGTVETLLNVPHYDYYWQHVYVLENPKQMPRGTRIHVVSHFDNSEDNLRNPDPDVTVVYGREYYSHYEMMIGTIGFIHELSGDNPIIYGQRIIDEKAGQPERRPDFAKLMRGYTKRSDVTPENLPAFYYQRGLFRELHGDLNGAIADYTVAIERDPAHADALMKRSLAWSKKSAALRSLEDLNSVIAQDPTHVEAYLRRGLLWSDAKKKLADFDRVIELDPWNTQAHFHRAGTLKDTGDVESALAVYTRIIDEINPGFEEAYWKRGEIHLSQGEDDLAERDFAYMVHRRPTWKPAALLLMGSARIKRGDFAAALADFQEIVSLNADNAQAHRAVGVCHMQLGNLDEAIAEFEETVRLEPNEALAHFSLASAYEKPLPEKAVAHYRQTLALRPDMKDAAARLAWILSTHPDESLRDAAGAVEFAELACDAANANNASYVDILAAAHAEDGQFPLAVTTAKRALELATASGQHTLAADIRDRLKRYEASQPFRMESLE